MHSYISVNLLLFFDVQQFNLMLAVRGGGGLKKEEDKKKVSFQFKPAKQWKGKCIIWSVESSLVHPTQAAESI